MNPIIEQFRRGKPSGTSNITRSASGALQAWFENGFSVTVSRYASDNTVRVQIKKSTMVYTEVLRFDASGRYIGSDNESIPTDFAGELQKGGVAGAQPKDQVSLAAKFRSLGGKIAAFYYGEWCQSGTSYNQWPWRWFTQFKDRLPVCSVGLPFRYLFDFTKWFQGTYANTTLSTAADGAVIFTDTTTDALWISPDIVRPRIDESAVLVYGKATASSTTTLINDSGRAWTVNQFYKQRLVMLSGQNAKNVTGAVADSATGSVLLTVTAHGLSTGQSVRVKDVEGITGANGFFTITVVDVNTVLLQGSIFKGTYTAGGVMGVYKTINSNTSTGLTLASALPFTPAVGDVYTIETQQNEYGALGSEYQAVRVKVKRINVGSTWAGELRFITVDDQTFDEVKKLTVPEPAWSSDGYSDVVFDMSNNATWNSKKILKFRIDLFASIGSNYQVKEIELVTTSPRAQAENAEIVGLPSDVKWAVDWELKQAKEHGIDVFIHNMYWSKSQYPWKFTNHQDYNLSLHAASTAAPDMAFCLQWSNHDTTNPLTSKADWYELVDYWYSYFQNGRYHKIDGKHVVYLFSVNNLLTWAATLYTPLSGLAAVKAMLDDARARVIAKPSTVAPSGIYFVGMGSVDHPYWAGDNTATGGTWTGGYKQAGCDAITVYNQFQSYYGQVVMNSGGTVGGTYPATTEDLTYSTFSEVYDRASTWVLEKSNTTLSYQPSVIAGWDKRPWVWYNNGGGFNYRNGMKSSWNCRGSESMFREHCNKQLAQVLSHEDKFKSTPPLVTMYAWNEYGEGGFLAPTVGEGWTKLQAIKEIFGT